MLAKLLLSVGENGKFVINFTTLFSQKMKNMCIAYQSIYEKIASKCDDHSPLEDHPWSDFENSKGVTLFMRNIRIMIYGNIDMSNKQCLDLTMFYLVMSTYFCRTTHDRIDEILAGISEKVKAPSEGKSIYDLLRPMAAPLFAKLSGIVESHIVLYRSNGDRHSYHEMSIF